MAKHRSNLFVVLRTQAEEWNSSGSVMYINPTVLGVYETLDRAEEVQGKYQQEMIDKGLGDYFEFEVQTVTYYDE